MTHKCTVAVARLLVVLFLAVLAMAAANRVAQGKVVGAQGQPVSAAIVYLQNTKTTDIKSFISTSDGSFVFEQLSPEIDYEIWAVYKGAKSATKSVSSSNSRKVVTITLKVK
jgi:hypothetical protein